MLEPVLNQILQAEMTDPLEATSSERTDDRCGYRNGSCQRQLTARVGALRRGGPVSGTGSTWCLLSSRPILYLLLWDPELFAQDSARFLQDDFGGE